MNQGELQGLCATWGCASLWQYPSPMYLLDITACSKPLLSAPQMLSLLFNRLILIWNSRSSFSESGGLLAFRGIPMR